MMRKIAELFENDMDDDFLDDISSETKSNNSDDASDDSDTDDINLEEENDTLIKSEEMNLPNTWSLISPVTGSRFPSLETMVSKQTFQTHKIQERFFKNSLMKIL